MVKDSQQVHGVIQILLPQGTSERTVVEKEGAIMAFVNQSVKSGGGGVFYLSALMVRMSVSLLYRSPTSLIIFLRAWSSRFRLDSFTCKHNIIDHIQTVIQTHVSRQKEKLLKIRMCVVLCILFNRIKSQCKLFSPYTEL